MENLLVKKSYLPWWVGGLVLGLVQILAVWQAQPLGVSTQFVVADTQILMKTSPDYVATHPLINSDKYQKIGYGWWFDIGILFGAYIMAMCTKRWKLQATTVWWNTNHIRSAGTRLAVGFFGGILILFGARLAHGCTSGQFASGWAQLSLGAVPFTISLFIFAMIAAYIIYPKTPAIER